MRRMKRMLALWLPLLLLVGCTPPTPEPEPDLLPWPTTPVTLWASSDLHWQEPSDSFRPAYLDEIIETLLDQAHGAEPQALLLCGDLTNGGNLEEHQAVSTCLKKAQENGLKIFVTMGNHDMDHSVPPKTLTELYAPFGWEQALSRDERSMSYLAALTDELWLLSLDSNFYGDRGTGVGGIIEEETLSWVRDCLDRAKEAGALVVPFSHHNLLVRGMTEESRSNYYIEGGEDLQELFLDCGVPLYFSGHRHSSSLNQVEYEGKVLIETVVPTPTTCPYYYTAVTFEPEGTVQHAYQTLDVEAWARRTGREEPEFIQFTGQNRMQIRQQWEKNAVGMMESMGIPPEERGAMVEFFVDFLTQYQNHCLWQEGERLRQDPALALWTAHAHENNYARWIPMVLESMTNDAPEQTLGPFREKT